MKVSAEDFITWGRESAQDQRRHDGRAIRDRVYRMMYRRFRGKAREVVAAEFWPRPETPPDLPGLNHSWKKVKGALLYPGDDQFWLAWSRIARWSHKKIDAYLDTPPQRVATHVIVSTSTGQRGELNETPFDMLASPENTKQVLDNLIYLLSKGKQPIVECMTWEHLVQNGYLRNEEELLARLEAITRLVAPYCQFVFPFREMGRYGDGSREGLARRNRALMAIRAGSPDVVVSEHERPLEEIPVEDFTGIGGRTASLLQVGFDTPTEEAAIFVKANGVRMAGYARDHHILSPGSHANIYFEGSIPSTPKFNHSWALPSTWEQAQMRGRRIREVAGEFCHGDMSSGVG